MKKIKIIIGTIALVALVFPLLAQARSLSELKAIQLVSYTEINEMCGQPPGYDPVSGCYLYDDRIIIRNDLPRERFIWVFWHEMGHFFLKDNRDWSMFNPTPQKLDATIITEIAADSFAVWMMGGGVPKGQADLLSPVPLAG